MYYIMTDYQQVLNDPHREVYLTAGKLYPAKLLEGTDIYNISDDSGYAIGVSINRPSAHLNDAGVFKLYKLEQVLD